MTSQGHSSLEMLDGDMRRSPSRIAIGIRGAVAPLQADLMRALALRPIDEEIGIEGDAAAGPDVQLHHPAVDAFGIELRVDGSVKRIGEKDAPAVPAHFDHLWTA